MEATQVQLTTLIDGESFISSIALFNKAKQISE
jgi:hypothetical protein